MIIPPISLMMMFKSYHEQKHKTMSTDKHFGKRDINGNPIVAIAKGVFPETVEEVRMQELKDEYDTITEFDLDLMTHERKTIWNFIVKNFQPKTQ